MDQKVDLSDSQLSDYKMCSSQLFPIDTGLHQDKPGLPSMYSIFKYNLLRTQSSKPIIIFRTDLHFFTKGSQLFVSEFQIPNSQSYLLQAFELEIVTADRLKEFLSYILNQYKIYNGNKSMAETARYSAKYFEEDFETPASYDTNCILYEVVAMSSGNKFEIVCSICKDNLKYDPATKVCVV